MKPHTDGARAITELTCFAPKVGICKGKTLTSGKRLHDPPVLNILRRVSFGTGSKFGTEVAKRYGEGSEVLVFLGDKRQEKQYRK